MNAVLENKVAVVTGSTAGIGEAIARALAKQGCRVVLNGRNASEHTQALRADIQRTTGVETSFIAADVSKPNEIHNLMAQAAQQLGGIDILVNNAGIQHVAPLSDFDPAMWDLVIATHLSAAFHATQAVLPGMRTRHWGRIINIASAHALVASPFKAAYVAAKHGLLGLTKVSALETAEQGITCNAICPGYVWTRLVEDQIEAQCRVHGLSRDAVIREVILAPQPNKRFVEVDEVAALAVFLASDTGKSITGAALPIEGGWTAR